MGLLLYTKPFEHPRLQLLPWCPKKAPYTQSVNRVMQGIDPFNYTLGCETFYEITQVPTNNKTYEEMATERAMQFKQLDGDIYIMYSGGVDSTTAVTAFILTWSDEELQRVHILATTQSIAEFPEMWNLIVEKFKGRISTSYKHVEKICRKGHVITGEHGDQIFGSDVLRQVIKFHGEEGIHSDWQTHMPKVYNSMFGEETSKKFIEVYSQTTVACPFPIKSCFDWVWWYNFTNKWQHVKYRLLAYKPWEEPSKTFPNIHHFFDTPEWQRWSIDNHDKKIKDTFESYKHTAKKFIVKHTKYYSYLTKKKIPSLRNLWAIKGFYDAIDTNLNYLEDRKALEYINGRTIRL
jgi:hypothetical protein